MRSTGCPKRWWSAWMSGVSSTMSPMAPHRMTSGRTVAVNSLQLASVVAAGFRHLEQATLADEMERTDDDEIVLVFLQQLLDLRHPLAVPIRNERVVEVRRY